MTGLIAAVGIAALIPAAWILRDVPLATLAGVLILIAARIFEGWRIPGVLLSVIE